MAGIRGGGGVQTNVSLAKKSEVNDSVNSVTSIRLHKRWGVNTLQYSHPLTRPVTHLALSCNALYTWLTYISNYHNNRTLIIGEKSIKILFASKYFLYLTEEKLKFFFYKLKDILMKALKAYSDPDCLAKSNLKLRHINLLLSWRSRLLLNSIQNLVSIRPLIEYSSCLPLDRSHSL